MSPGRLLRLAAVAAAALLLSPTHAVYLPGIAPKDYKEGAPVPVTVNSLSSPNSVVSHNYYDMGFCEPKDGKQSQPESLGSLLFGDRIYNSPLEVFMKINVTCKVQCSSETVISAEKAKFINLAIKERYNVDWYVDDLPVAYQTRYRDRNNVTQSLYRIGFPLGQVVKSKENSQDIQYFINNHITLIIDYHHVADNRDGDVYRVVGVRAKPASLNTLIDDDGVADCATAARFAALKEDAENKIVFTYSVEWQESPTPWATRWDPYLEVKDANIHWFSLIFSTVIVLFLSGTVAVILLRALHKDIARYSQLETTEDAQEEFGWKLVHGDVFRPPKNSILLSVVIGSGVQILLMTIATLFFAMLGFLSPSNRGYLETWMLVFFVVFASCAGYISARMYKMFGGEKWKKNVAFTALLLPGTMFVCFLILNFFLIGTNASSAVPFGSIVALCALWILVSAPLSVVGSYFGFRHQRIEAPVKTNQIPRQIPEQVFYLNFLPSVLMGGILPFSAIFIELYFIMSSIWVHTVYYVFGFLFLVFLILVITCSELTILMCYFHLCSEDYHWWWRSFFTSGASALYMFLYSIVFYGTNLTMVDAASGILYFGWTIIMCMLMFLLTGTIGFLACWWFVQKIYSSIKID